MHKSVNFFLPHIKEKVIILERHVTKKYTITMVIHRTLNEKKNIVRTLKTTAGLHLYEAQTFPSEELH